MPSTGGSVTTGGPISLGNGGDGHGMSTGGGKIKRERTKMRESTKMNVEEEPETPSYDLGVVPTISVDSKISLDGL